MHLLLQGISDAGMGVDERVVKLLGLEMEVARRGYHAKDQEGVPHEGIRRTSVDAVLISSRSRRWRVSATGKVGDNKSLSFLSVLTISSISTKKRQKDD